MQLHPREQLQQERLQAHSESCAQCCGSEGQNTPGDEHTGMALPAVVQEMWGQDRNVNVLPEHRVEHGCRPMDAGS